MFITVTPAYGAVCKSVKDVMAHWNANKDFEILSVVHGAGRMVNKQDAPKGCTLEVRYTGNRSGMTLNKKEKNLTCGT